jgi:hypothetical protein
MPSIHIPVSTSTPPLPLNKDPRSASPCPPRTTSIIPSESTQASVLSGWSDDGGNSLQSTHATTPGGIAETVKEKIMENQMVINTFIAGEWSHALLSRRGTDMEGQLRLQKLTGQEGWLERRAGQSSPLSNG